MTAAEHDERDAEFGLGVAQRMRLPGPRIGRARPAQIGSVASSSLRFAAALARPAPLRRRLQGPEVAPVHSFRNAGTAPPRWWHPASAATPERVGLVSRGERAELPRRGLPRAVHRIPDEQSWTPGGIAESLVSTAAQVRRFDAVTAAGPMLTSHDRAKLNAATAARRAAAAASASGGGTPLAAVRRSPLRSPAPAPSTARTSGSAPTPAPPSIGSATPTASAHAAPAPGSPAPGSSALGSLVPGSSPPGSSPLGTSPRAMTVRASGFSALAAVDGPASGGSPSGLSGYSASPSVAAPARPSWAPPRATRFAVANRTALVLAAPVPGPSGLPARRSMSRPAVSSSVVSLPPAGELGQPHPLPRSTSPDAVGQVPASIVTGTLAGSAGRRLAGSASLRRMLTPASSLDPALRVGVVTPPPFATPGRAGTASSSMSRVDRSAAGREGSRIGRRRARTGTTPSAPTPSAPTALTPSAPAPTAFTSSGPAPVAPAASALPLAGRPTSLSSAQPVSRDPAASGALSPATAAGTPGITPTTVGALPAAASVTADATPIRRLMPWSAGELAAGRALAAAVRPGGAVRPALAVGRLPTSASYVPMPALGRQHVTGVGTESVRLQRSLAVHPVPAGTAQAGTFARPVDSSAPSMLGMSDLLAAGRPAQRGAAAERGSSLASAFGVVEHIRPAGAAAAGSPTAAPGPGAAAWPATAQRSSSHRSVHNFGTFSVSGASAVSGASPGSGTSSVGRAWRPAASSATAERLRRATSGAAAGAATQRRRAAAETDLLAYLPAPPPVSVRSPSAATTAAPPIPASARSGASSRLVPGPDGTLRRSLVDVTADLLRAPADAPELHEGGQPMALHDQLEQSHLRVVQPGETGPVSTDNATQPATDSTILDDPRRLEELVDKVVERIETRVIDELERRGRRHDWGVF